MSMQTLKRMVTSLKGPFDRHSNDEINYTKPDEFVNKKSTQNIIKRMISIKRMNIDLTTEDDITQEDKEFSYTTKPLNVIPIKAKNIKYNTAEKVEIIIAKPSKTTIPSSIPLSGLDLSRPYDWDVVIHAFKNETGDLDFMSIDKLKESLSEALKLLPIVAGELDNFESNYNKSNSEAKILLNNRGVWFVTTRTSMDFDETLETHLNKHVIPDDLRFKLMERTMGVPFQPKEKQAPLFAVKVVVFPCGSMTLTTMMCHLIADHNARFEFMRLWSGLFRKEKLLPKLTDMRTEFMPEVNSVSRALAKEWSSYRYPHTNSASELHHCLVSIPNDKIISLASRVNSDLADASQMARPDDLVNAIIWRAMTRARELFPDESTSHARLVDIRKASSLENSFCNAVIITPLLPFTVGQLLSIPLGDIASQLWRKETRVNSTYSKDYIGALSLINQKGRPLWKLSDHLQQNCFSISFASQIKPIPFSCDPCCWFRESPSRDGALITYPPINGVRKAQVCLYKFHMQKFLRDAELIEEGFSTLLMSNLD